MNTISIYSGYKYISKVYLSKLSRMWMRRKIDENNGEVYYDQIKTDASNEN